MKIIVCFALLLFVFAKAPTLATDIAPVRLIFDTDMGNDVDDALALGVIHALTNRGECQLLAVTITKDNQAAAPYVDAINTFYGRGDVPVGMVRNGVTPNDSRFLPLADATEGDRPLFPHDLRSGKDADTATTVLRRVLAVQPNNSVTVVQVGLSTNLAQLLESPPDEYSSLDGSELVKCKVKLLSAMAGAFQMIQGARRQEFNVLYDNASARKVIADWPTPIVFSGVEIGYAILYPKVSIERDFRYLAHHPMAQSYQLYRPTPHERPCWDLTSVLYAVRPDRGYFDLSPLGRVEVDEEGYTEFEANTNGSHRYLIANDQQIVRTKEALALLVSQPPRIDRLGN